MKKYSLVAFTILSQLAVGAFWTLALVSAWVAWHAGWKTAHDLTAFGWPLVSAGMGIAILASFFHLGNPTRAWRALSNLRQSWLSREILLASLFAGASSLFAGLQSVEWGSPDLLAALGVVAGLVGLALVYAMSRAYRLRTVPAWNTWVTPASFFVATFLLGALVVGAGLVVCSRYLPVTRFDAPTDLIRAILQRIAAGALILLAMELFLISLRVSQDNPSASRDPAIRMVRKRRMFFVLRCIAAVAGIAGAGAAVFLSCESCLAAQGFLIVTTFGFALAAEVLGRIFFYEARMRVGV
jgi:anaerobic dimethyl sulfoxide reductase subunit C